MLEDHDIAAGSRRLGSDDPLLPVATGSLARQAGYTQFWTTLATRTP